MRRPLGDRSACNFVVSRVRVQTTRLQICYGVAFLIKIVHHLFENFQNTAISKWIYVCTSGEDVR